jgi:hypothetical protein
LLGTPATMTRPSASTTSSGAHSKMLAATILAFRAVS